MDIPIPESMEQQLEAAFVALEVKEEDAKDLKKYLEQLKEKDAYTYGHCIRVGLLERKIGELLGMKERALLFSGLLHDIGKIDIPLETLKKTSVWSKEDYLLIEQHVMKGYERIKARFPFTAEIVLLHHKFQKHAYPEVIPPYLHEYSEESKKLIIEHAKVLVFADVYDALHRENSRNGAFGRLTEAEIKVKMLEEFPDRAELTERLYLEGIIPFNFD